MKDIVEKIQEKKYKDAICLSKKYTYKSKDIKKMAEKNLFNLSRWGFETAKYELFLRSIVKISRKPNLRTELSGYLKSMSISKDIQDKIFYSLDLTKASRYLNKESKDIKKLLSNPSSFKSIMVSIEFIFLNYNEISQYKSPEGLVSALSSALWHSIKQGSGCVPNINLDLVAGKSRNKVLKYFESVNKYKELEMLPFLFDMSIEKVDSHIHLNDVNKTYEMYRAGFISTDIQKYLKHHIDEPSLKKDLSAMAEMLLQAGVIQKASNPDRYRIELTLEAYKLISKAFKMLVHGLDITSEEKVYINEVFYELNITDDVYEQESFDLRSLIKVRRFLNAFYYLFTEFVYNVEDDKIAVANSIIFEIQEKHFHTFARSVLKESYTYLKGMIYEDINEILDIQYSPLIALNNKIYPLFATAHASDTIRNYMRKNRFRFNASGALTPLEDMLSDALKKQGIKSEISPIISGQEKDLIFKVGNTTFVIECKNNLIGTSLHETKTTLDYLDKAVKQLNHAMEKSQIKKLGDVEYFNGDKCGAIVLGNRLFSGSRYKGYKVIYINELLSFIETDTMDIVEISKDKINRKPIKYRNELTENSIKSYLTYECRSMNTCLVTNQSNLGSLTISHDEYIAKMDTDMSTINVIDE